MVNFTWVGACLVFVLDFTDGEPVVAEHVNGGVGVESLLLSVEKQFKNI